MPQALAGAEVLAPHDPPALPDAARTLAGALARPLGAPDLARFVEPVAP